MKNLVMGVAKGYNWNDIEPFVNSFKQNCLNADLVLFMDNPSKFTENKLNRGGVRIEQIPENLKHMVVNTRWEMYENFLSSHPEYEKIFCTDIRDVIFQGDLFSSYTEYKNFLVYATEGQKIQDDQIYNSKWIRHLFGENEYQKIKDNTAVCCGTIYGSCAGINILFEDMTKIFFKDTTWGNDQGALNYFIHNKILPIENQIESNVETGELFTVGVLKNFPIVNEKILRGDGGVPAVVHQYDRHPQLVQLVDNLYREKDFQPDENFTDLKSALAQMFCLVQRQNFNAATKFFINYVSRTKNLNLDSYTLLKLAEFILQRYNPDAEFLILLLQKTLVTDFSSGITIQQIERIYRFFVVAKRDLHCVNPEFTNFVKNMLVACIDAFYKNNNPELGKKYVNLLADWSN